MPWHLRLNTRNVLLSLQFELNVKWVLIFAQDFIRGFFCAQKSYPIKHSRRSIISVLLIWFLVSLSSDRFALEPLLPKKLHCKSQDKLDRDEPEKDRKEKKKEKRNSKHQELFDKELKTADIPLQPSEAVILSETVSVCPHK